MPNTKKNREPLSPVQARAVATVERILDTVRRHLRTEDGYPLVLAAVTQEAGLARTGIYRYFDGAGGVLTALVQHFAERSARQLVAAIEAIPPGLDEAAACRAILLPMIGPFARAPHGLRRSLFRYLMEHHHRIDPAIVRRCLPPVTAVVARYPSRLPKPLDAAALEEFTISLATAVKQLALSQPAMLADPAVIDRLAELIQQRFFGDPLPPSPSPEAPGRT